MRRIARLAVLHPRIIVGFWLICLVVGASEASLLQARISNEGYVVGGSQSGEALRLAEHHIHSLGRSSFVVLLHSDAAGNHGQELMNAATRMSTMLGRRRDVSTVYSPQISLAGEDVVVGVGLRTSLGEAQKEMPQLERAVKSTPHEGLTISTAGEVPSFRAFSTVAVRDVEVAERYTMPITAAILLVAFLSAVAIGLPLLQAGVALILTFAALSVLATIVNLSVFVSNTATLIGLALSIDYSLFLVTRYREERKHDGMSVQRAIEATVGSAGRAVLISGIAVSITMLSLLTLGIGIFSSMAIGAAITAAIAAAVALTFVPAMLMVLGDRVDRFTVSRISRGAERGRLSRRVSRMVLRWPAPIVILASLGLAALTIPALDVQVTYPGPLSLPRGNTVHEASMRIADSFVPGALSPVLVVTKEDLGEVTHVANANSEVFSSLTTRKGSGGWGALILVLRAASGQPAAQRAVHNLRSQLPGEGAHRTYVGGETANGIDITNRVHKRFIAMIIVGALLSLMVLIPAYRSIIVPLKAVLTSLLSVGATLGILTLGWRIWGSGGELAYFVPPFLFAIVFALALDYEVFLLSRIQEEYHNGAENSEAVTRGLNSSARAITLAAIVMVSVFAAFALSSLSAFRQLGVGLSLAVLIDATVVRMLLVPAALHLLGERNWWWATNSRAHPRAVREVVGATTDSGQM